MFAIIFEDQMHINNFVFSFIIKVVLGSTLFLGSIFNITPLFLDDPHALPWKFWIPFEMTETRFRLIYLWNTYINLIAAIATVAIDSLVYSFIAAAYSRF